MARGKKGNKIDGWINLYKPLGLTSNQALGKVKRALKPQKAGHAGTLDPLASGILPLALGAATKTVEYAQNSIKTYKFTVTWGQQRSTDDGEGDIIQSADQRPSKEEIEALLPEFTGDIEQIPPQFSAVKVDGERAYDIARDGEQVALKSRQVHIESLKILNNTPDETTFECICGKGTYIRSLARDMGRKLGCFGYISALERTAVGPFTLENAISLDIFENMGDNAAHEDAVLPLQTVLADIPALALKEMEAARLKNGQTLSFLAKPDLDRLKQIGIQTRQETTALALFGDKALALITVEGPEIRPLRILNV